MRYSYDNEDHAVSEYTHTIRRKTRRPRRRKLGGALILCAAAALAAILILRLPRIIRIMWPDSQLGEKLSDGIDHLLPDAVQSVPDDLPENLQELLDANPETKDFVLGYADWDGQTGSISQSDLNGGVPLLLQWDKRWGYVTYGSDLLAITGCGPTCLAMVRAYLLNDISMSPADIAAFSEENGYYVPGNGSSWTLMTEGASALGLKASSLALWEDGMIQELQAGHPIICSLGPGDFTTKGHFIVVTGYADGVFTVNDPFSKIRSEQTWDYNTLAPQILNLWSFTAA